MIASIPNLFTLIGLSWDFARKQPTVLQGAFWFVFLPTFGGNLLADYQLSQQEYLQNRPEILLLLMLAQVLLAMVLLWGTACILSIGKRLLQAKSGRTRSSFKIVSAQANAAFFPLLLTSILRSILTILWGLLLIVPGIIYFFKTAFYPVVVVCEGLSYRPALKRCLEISHGQWGNIALTIIGLSILTLLPAQIIAGMLSYMAEDLGIGALIASNIASGLLFTLALTLYLFGLIGAYDHFRPRGHVRN
jgi:uncharacterized membrane protein